MKVLPVALAAVMLLGASPPSPSAAPAGAVHLPGKQARQQPVRDKIDVNTATQEQLEQVPGIGPALARRILEWRRQNGPFETLEELLHVRGIGPRTLDKLRPYLEVGAAKGTVGATRRGE